MLITPQNEKPWRFFLDFRIQRAKFAPKIDPGRKGSLLTLN